MKVTVTIRYAAQAQEVARDMRRVLDFVQNGSDQYMFSDEESTFEFTEALQRAGITEYWTVELEQDCDNEY